jgi:bifunctional polynucleotide phosphatase/kinase
MNLKVPFHTPEEYFLGDPPAQFIMGAFNPLDYMSASSLNSTAARMTELIKPVEKPDIILFVGTPAAGKSTFFREYLAPMGYARVNQDTLKTRDRCVAEASVLLQQNTPIAIGICPES